MKRLLATIRCDIRLQFRNGFYYAAAFVAVIVVLVLRWLSAPNPDRWLPVLVLNNLLINTFYFIAGLVLLEKGEGTMEAQIVTPLRSWEYLASKVITLMALSLVESSVIVGIVCGWEFNLFAMIIGIVLIAALFCFIGFMVVIRYDSINEYLFPSILYTTVLLLPLLHYFEIWPSWLYYLHPVQAPLFLLQAAFRPIAHGLWIYGVLYAGLWIVLVYMLSQRAFHRFVIAKEGTR